MKKIILILLLISLNACARNKVQYEHKKSPCACGIEITNFRDC